jgi:hypothetical protein
MLYKSRGALTRGRAAERGAVGAAASEAADLATCGARPARPLPRPQTRPRRLNAPARSPPPSSTPCPPVVLALTRVFTLVPTSAVLSVLAGRVKRNAGSLEFFAAQPKVSPELPHSGPDFTAPEDAPLKTQQVGRAAPRPRLHTRLRRASGNLAAPQPLTRPWPDSTLTPPSPSPIRPPSPTASCMRRCSASCCLHLASTLWSIRVTPCGAPTCCACRGARRTRRSASPATSARACRRGWASRSAPPPAGSAPSSSRCAQAAGRAGGGNGGRERRCAPAHCIAPPTHARKHPTPPRVPAPRTPTHL